MDKMKPKEFNLKKELGLENIEVEFHPGERALYLNFKALAKIPIDLTRWEDIKKLDKNVKDLKKIVKERIKVIRKLVK